MSDDARFADGSDAPLRLKARDAGDLTVMAALVQDALVTPARMMLAARKRRFAFGLHRFRWEDAQTPGAARRGYERVQSLLIVEDVRDVRSRGVDQGQKDQALAILDLTFEPDIAPAGLLVVRFAGGAELRLSVEALEITLRDVTRPYLAPSGQMPVHE